MALDVNAKTKAEAIARGWGITKVEQTIPRVFIKRDAFGFGDFLVARPGSTPALIQATSTGDVHKRIRKICGPCEPQARDWLESNGAILVWGFKKYKRPIARRFIRLTEYEVTLVNEEFVVSKLRDGERI